MHSQNLISSALSMSLNLFDLGISAVICYFGYRMMGRVPIKHRKIEPEMVWVFMLMGFNRILSFFVFPKMAASFKSYFDSQNITDEGDCALRLSRCYCIVALILYLFQLYIGFWGKEYFLAFYIVSSLVSLTLLVFVFRRFWALMKRVTELTVTDK